MARCRRIDERRDEAGADRPRRTVGAAYDVLMGKTLIRYRYRSAKFSYAGEMSSSLIRRNLIMAFTPHHQQIASDKYEVLLHWRYQFTPKQNINFVTILLYLCFCFTASARRAKAVISRCRTYTASDGSNFMTAHRNPSISQRAACQIRISRRCHVFIFQYQVATL